jgi:hypothetical protein
MGKRRWASRRLLFLQKASFFVVCGVAGLGFLFAAPIASAAAGASWITAAPGVSEYPILRLRVSGSGERLRFIREGETLTLSDFPRGISFLSVEADWPFARFWHSAYVVLLRGDVDELPKGVAESGPLVEGQDYWAAQWGWLASSENVPSYFFIPNTGTYNLPKIDEFLPEKEPIPS